jgi:hypothetical protein
MKAGLGAKKTSRPRRNLHACIWQISFYVHLHINAVVRHVTLFVCLGTCSLGEEMHRAIQLLWKYRYYLIVNVNGFMVCSVQFPWKPIGTEHYWKCRSG